MCTDDKYNSFIMTHQLCKTHRHAPLSNIQCRVIEARTNPDRQARLRINSNATLSVKLSATKCHFWLVHLNPTNKCCWLIKAVITLAWNEFYAHIRWYNQMQISVTVHPLPYPTPCCYCFKNTTLNSLSHGAAYLEPCLDVNLTICYRNYRTKLESVCLSFKRHRSKTANIKILSANSTHRR